jgi:hypothetical protein
MFLVGVVAMVCIICIVRALSFARRSAGPAAIYRFAVGRDFRLADLA